MVVQWFSYGFPMVFPFCPYPMVFPWFPYGFPMVALWFSCVPYFVRMVSLLFSYCFIVAFLCVSYGFPMCFLWSPYCSPMVFPWFSDGFPMVSRWCSYGFPMVFPWFSLFFSFFLYPFSSLYPFTNFTFYPILSVLFHRDLPLATLAQQKIN